MREPLTPPVEVRPRRSPPSTTPAEDPSAVLLVRVWREEGSGAFRARLLVEGAPGARGAELRTVAVGTSPGEVTVAVRHWLDAFLDDTRRRPDGGR
jgi:hypothetical protein